MRSKPCPFCGEKAKNIARFHEHFYFCPECSAIYTKLMLQESSCIHVTDDSYTVIREPWYKEAREKVPYIKEMDCDIQKCSVCGAGCMSDGW